MISHEYHFAMEYHAEAIDAPSSGASDFAFTDSSPSSRSVTISITPFSDRDSWIGIFATSAPSTRLAISGLYGTPSPTHLCVVERGTAFIVNVKNPELTELVHTEGPIVAVNEVSNPPLLLASTPWAVTAIGSGRAIWTSPRLAIDGFRLDEVIDGELFGVADPDDDEPRDFILNLRNGTRTSGITNLPE